MALKFINTNNTGATIKFVSSQDFPIGSPVYYKQIGFGNYALTGDSGNKTASITLITGISGLTIRNLYFNFSDITVPSNNYISTISSSGLNISVPGINTSSVASGTVNTWQHVAVTRSGTSMRLFVNGIQQGSTQTISTSYNLSTTSTTVGSQGTSYLLNGYIDDLRVTKGYARYTGNFTPINSSHPLR